MSFSLALVRHLLCRWFAPAGLLKETYKAFQGVLEHDRRSHELLASLERFYHEESRVDYCAVSRAYDGLTRAVSEMIRQLDAMAPGSYSGLFSILRGIDVEIRGSALRFEKAGHSTPLALPLLRLPPGSAAVAGGKAETLSRIAAELNLPVPGGFVLTTRAFDLFCEVHRLAPKIEAALALVDVDSPSSLETASAQITSAIRSATLPPDLEKAVRDTWPLMFDDASGAMSDSRAGGIGRYAVRSSAVGEDAAISFAGQYATILHVAADRFGEAYKEVLASKYSPNALMYRVSNGLLDQETPMAVLVLEMIDAAASGIVYSRSPVVPDSPAVTVYSVWGLGEPLVRGGTVPDVVEVARDGSGAILRKARGAAKTKAVLAPSGGLETVPLEPREREYGSVDEDTARQLAAWALRLENHFGVPQDMEWCLDRKGQLFILQSRPLRVEHPREESCRIEAAGIPNPLLFAGGEKAAPGVGSGRVVLAHSLEDLRDVPHGSVLVAHGTSPGWARILDRVSGVVTDLGSAAGHFASVAREWGVPALVNAGPASRILKPGEIVTLDADHGKVYAGVLEGLADLPCEKRRVPAASPFMKRLRLLLDRCSRLHLLDPRDPGFAPEACKSIHDLVRYTHEMAVREMFSVGDRGMGRVRGAAKLVSDIPITLYVLDLGDGTRRGSRRQREIPLEEVQNAGLAALWRGLSRPEITWSPDVLHFDWKEFDRLSAGIISLDSQMLSSFAVLSRDYLNIHIRFGYHFVVIDALFGPHPDQNYVSMRFKGGGAVPERRYLRVRFLDRVVREHGFDTRLEGDAIDVTQRGSSRPEMDRKLEMLGFLLGFARLLDQRIEDMDGVDSLARDFLEVYPP
ncbi:MAG: PEP/pyruvate-binding domain-containing protein [Thermodesulfobacteriota bacterium]